MRHLPLFLGLFCCVASLTASATAIELKPHRAIYSLRLANAASGSGVVDAQGAMVFEWAEFVRELGYPPARALRRVQPGRNERAHGGQLLELGG